MSRKVRYFCDRCEKELSYFDYKDRRLKAHILGRSFLICGDCDKEFNHWLHRTRVFKP